MHLREQTVAIDGVRREVEAERLLFLLHPLGQRPARACQGRDRRATRVAFAEQPALPAGPLFVEPRRRRQDRLGDRDNARAVRVDRIECAGRTQRLELPFVEQTRIDALCHIAQRREPPLGVPLGDQFLHRPLADALQRGERVANGVAVLVRLDREIGLARVDVGGQARHAQPAHVIDEHAQLVGQRHVEAHRRGVEFGRVMCLQPRGLIGEQRIGRRVALVEAVARELVDQVEQLVGLGRRDVVMLLAAGDEDRALLVHLRLDLLAHRAAQQVGAAERVAGQDLRGLHHLFLIDEDAVGLGQDAFEQRMRIFDRLGALLAAAEARDIVHRARAVERDERDDVAEIGRPHRRQRAPHPFRFELEHADRVAALEQLEHAGIVHRQRAEIDLDTAPGEQLDAHLEDRQRLETEKVELHQPGALDIFHVELRHRHVRSRIAVERDELRQRPIADHHARRVGRAVPRQPLQLAREIEQVAHRTVILVFRRQLADAVERAIERPRIGRQVGHQLGKPIDLAIAHLQHAAGILQNRARLQLSEGDDLRHLIAAVFLLDVADHLAAPRFAEVDVEIGHRHALGVEEALEQQPQLQRIEIGDGQRPRDHRSRARTAPRPHRNVVILRPFDEVGDDQEITGEAHLDDDVELELEPVEIGIAPLFAQRRALDRGDLGQPRVEPGARVVAQLGGFRLAVAGKARQDRLALGRGNRAALRHDQRVVDRLGQVGKQLAHRRGGLQPGIGRGPRPIVAGDICRIGNAQHRIVRLAEIGFGKTARIGRDQRQIAVIGEVEQMRLGAGLDIVVAAGDLDVKPVGEQRLQPFGIGPRAIMLFLSE